MSDTTPDPLDAYALLSRPTLDYSDAEIEAVVVDLRKRRAAYLSSGKVDKPKAAAKATAKLSADDKARNSEALLASLKLDFS